MKARDVSAATAGRTGTHRRMILMGALGAFVCAVVFAALLGTGAPSAGADAACSNEPIRLAQHATQTADCRAWERVSPADKNGGDILGEKLSTVAASSGGAVAFSSNSGFANTIGSGQDGRVTYVARRDADNWSTRSTTPTSQPEAIQVFTAPTKVEYLSQELDNLLVWGYDLPAATDRVPFHNTLYLEDTAGGSLRTIGISQEEPLRAFDFLNVRELDGASADLRHVAFGSTTRLLPEAPGDPKAGEGVRSIYQWDDGLLQLASILPDGEPAPGGATTSPARGNPYTMSRDGSHMTFKAEGQLYVRIDGERTAWMSEPENTSFSGTPMNVAYEGMTPNGRDIFFVTESPLLDEDTHDGPDLYRWTDGPDPEHEHNLTLITNNGGAVNFEGGFGRALIGMSDDGTRVYVHNAGGQIELWEEGSGIRTFAEVGRPNGEPNWLTLMATDPGVGRVSPDGNWFAYIVEGELRLYDRLQDRTTTIAHSVTLIPTVTNSGAGWEVPGFRPRFLSPSADVFFTSAEALVQQDTNGVADVYEFDGATGQLHLVSSGKGDQPMMFADASTDGHDVFFVTRQRLVPSDRDDGVDVYDARVGGGFVEAEPSIGAPCAGETCQGPASSSPSSAPPASSALRGAGNLSHSVFCSAKKHQGRHKSKPRCQRKHGGHKTNRKHRHQGQGGAR